MVISSTVTNQNHIHKEVKSSLRPFCKEISSRVLCGKLNIKIYNHNCYLPTALWVRNLVFHHNERTQNEYEKRTPKKIFEAKRKSNRKKVKNYTSAQQIILLG